jgi:hypothetical protein
MPAKGRTVMHSRLIAGFIGPLLAAIGIAMVFNRSLFPALISQLAQSYGLIFLSGILSLLAGIAIVRVHNVWSGGWRIVVTLFGWLAILGGLARMWAPQLAAPIADTFAADTTGFLIGGIVVLALGAFLSYKAYGPEA